MLPNWSNIYVFYIYVIQTVDVIFYIIISDEKKFVRFDWNPFLFPFDWLRK